MHEEELKSFLNWLEHINFVCYPSLAIFFETLRYTFGQRKLLANENHTFHHYYKLCTSHLNLKYNLKIYHENEEVWFCSI